jgi:transcriptional antiterminator NusG
MFAAAALEAAIGEREVAPVAEWFAVQTRPRHEKSVTTQLDALGFKTFAPMVREDRRWSDRRKQIETPLFSGYTFVNFSPSLTERIRILRLYGVNGFVGPRGQGLAIPDKQIADIQTVLKENIGFRLLPSLEIGQRVRVRGGCLDGIEGILTAKNSDQTLLLSVEPIQQSLSIRIDGHHVELI